MVSSRSYALLAVASLASIARADNATQCNAYGIDFQDGGSYFINSASTDNFTLVTTFTGCNPNSPPANVWFVPPSTNEVECSTIPTTPDNVNQLSTCPIKKSDLAAEGSGEYIIVVFGDNGVGADPFGFERDFHLDIGPQVTTTVTPTVTYNVTTIPHETTTATSTLVIASTLNATTTYTIPAVTAPATKTVLPRPVTKTSSTTVTWTRTRYSQKVTLVVSTKTAVCIIPTRPPHHDPWIHYTPKKFHPQVLSDAKYRQRARQYGRRDNGLQKRAPDAPTVTSTFSPPVSVTSTVAGPAVTDTVSTSVTSTSYVTLPPSTIKTGTYTVTITLPTPTRTKYDVRYTTTLTTNTITAAWTFTKTTTPYAVRTSCYKAGGHFGGGWRW